VNILVSMSGWLVDYLGKTEATTTDTYSPLFQCRLRKGVNILVSTPGRLVDHLGKTEATTTDTYSPLFCAGCVRV
jgi:hypothetical protein